MAKNKGESWGRLVGLLLLSAFILCVTDQRIESLPEVGEIVEIPQAPHPLALKITEVDENSLRIEGVALVYQPAEAEVLALDRHQGKYGPLLRGFTVTFRKGTCIETWTFHDQPIEAWKMEGGIAVTEVTDIRVIQGN